MLSLFFTSSAASSIQLGHFPVSITATQLTDYTRLDPFAPSMQPRTLMISVFRPDKHCSNYTSTPYMPSITASYEDMKFSAYGVPVGTFKNLTLRTCIAPSSETRHNSNTFPLVLFSGALATSRYLYNAMAATVSSAGFLVVSVDHPYDTDIVEFPSGKTVLGLNLSDSQIPLAVETRAKDLSFVIDKFGSPGYLQSLLGRNTCDSVKAVKKVTAFAHSLGGAGVIYALSQDSRLRGGVNLDGSIFGPAVKIGTDKPVLLFGHEGKNLSTDSTWAELWPHLNGWKRELELIGSAHYTFSDLPLIATKLGGVEMLPEGTKSLIGRIDGERAMRVIGNYVEAFLDLVLNGSQENLLDGESKEFPEVKFVE
ncbi:PAF acetylhydrolase family protein [Glonium stellatum]|uniref:1-alkyl-2-acetylglycerophosphocholine esterase n=1 Tax=Glonium stellatum TaxID=574774 RepID=A0A8E2FAT3_9PEZI|nr:PAF acetylhydrolase family protein [Glonium stellatum]